MEGVPSLDNDPRLVYVTYAIAFIPLTIIYALDFISDKWKTIRDTRRNGIILLLLSFPSLGCIIAYIVLQIKNNDHKEAAAAITIACFNVFHVARTIWGLIQLYEFRNWNVSALRCLLHLGYRAPVYAYSEDVKNLISTVRGLSPWASIASSQSSYSSSSLSSSSTNIESVGEKHHRSKLKSLWSWIAGNMEEEEEVPGTPELMSLDSVKRTIDHHMIVNNSLIDNEFSQNELPVRTTLFSRVHFTESERHSALSRVLSSFLKSPMPEESSVRWLVAFLAKFGFRWLADTSRLPANTSEIEPPINLTKLETAQDLAVLASLQITYGSVDESGSTEGFKSLLSPSSNFCIEPKACRRPSVQITERCALPFKMKGFKSKFFDFGRHEATIRNAAKDDWHKVSLNKLDDSEQSAVENISSAQLACFAQLMEEHVRVSAEDDWDPIEIVQGGQSAANWEKDDPRIENLIYQLGYDKSPDYNQFFQEIPTPKEFLGTMLWDHRSNRLLFQISAHVDNFLALESGNCLEEYMKEHNPQCQATFPKGNLSVFQKQYNLEIRRLRSQILKPAASGFNPDCARFLGSLAETARSNLAEWVDVNGGDTKGWKPIFAPIGIRLKCSKQLISAFADAKMASQLESARSVHMRLLWELQARVHWSLTKECAREGHDIRESPFLILMFILGFPALTIEQLQQAGSPEIISNGDHTIKFHDECTLKPVEGPQDIQLLFKVDAEVENILVEVQAEEEFFNWNDWKDAFMGRMAAQKHWRSSRLLSKTERLREEASCTSILSPVEIVSKKDLGTYFDLQYWSGWPPCVTQISQFEIKKLVKLDDDEPYYECDPGDLTYYVSELSGMIDIHSEAHTSPESLYEKGCLALRERREEEAMKLFGRCISKHGHRGALETAVKEILGKNPISSVQEQDLRLQMDDWFNSVINRNMTDSVQNSKDTIDLDLLAQYFGVLYESCGYDNALLQKALVLFHKSEPDRPVPEVAIESIESFIVCEPDTGHVFKFKFYLAIAHQSRFHVSRDLSEQQLAAKYILQLGKDSSVIGEPLGISIGYLLEKGFYEGRNEQRKEPLLSTFWKEEEWERSARLSAMIDRLFVKNSAPRIEVPTIEKQESNSTSAFGIGKRPTDAVEVYKNMISNENEDGEDCFSEALNRLGMLYHMGAEGIPPSRSEALSYYSRAIDLMSNDSLCNIGVLEMGNNADGNDATSMKRSVEEHSSTGMNNLAIAYELGNGVDTDICEAEKLYERAVELDENPIAKYNLAMLYLRNDEQKERKEKFSKAKRMLDDLNSPEIELKPLYILKAHIVKLSKVWTCQMDCAPKWRVGVEEIDNCFAYVKIIEDDSVESQGAMN